MKLGRENVGQRPRRAKPKPPNKRSTTRIKMIQPVVLIFLSPLTSEVPSSASTRRAGKRNEPASSTAECPRIRHARTGKPSPPCDPHADGNDRCNSHQILPPDTCSLRGRIAWPSPLVPTPNEYPGPHEIKPKPTG